MRRNGKQYVNGKVYVRRTMCKSCIFGPKPAVDEERSSAMLAESDREGGSIPCHSHLYVGAEIEPICRGYFDRNNSTPLRIAEAMGVVEFINPREMQ